MRGLDARRAVPLLMGLLLALVMVACGGDDEEDDSGQLPVPRTRTVSGFVGNASTGRGIANASVRVGGQTVNTFANGEFRVEEVPLADQSVRIQATNYIERNFTLSSTQSTIDVRLEPVTTGGDGFQRPPGSPAL